MGRIFTWTLICQQTDRRWGYVLKTHLWCFHDCWSEKSLNTNKYVCAKSLQSCLTLCDPVDYSPPVSSFHGILQRRILEWVAMPSSRGSSQPRDWTHIFCIAGVLFTSWASREAHSSLSLSIYIYIYCRPVSLYIYI